MTKNSAKIIATALTAILALTGCSEAGRRRGHSSTGSVTSTVINATIDTGGEGESSSSAEFEESFPNGAGGETVPTVPEESSASSAYSEVEETSSATSSSTPYSTTTSTSTPSSATATSSSEVSSSSEETSVPVSSSTETSSDDDTPADNPVITHNCETDGHIWEIAEKTTEPKWCREMHLVYDNGFDGTLASRYSGLSMGEAYQIFLDSMAAIGVPGGSGSSTVTVEVWGTETYEVKMCTVCGEVVADTDYITVEPIGEWQFAGGKNKRWAGCDVLFYDPYNIPQAAIDSIRNYWGNDSD